VSDDRVQSDQIGRRDALRKAAAGAATAGIIWSAPRVEGLSMRPNYAGASSHTTETISVQLNSNSVGLRASGMCINGGSARMDAVLVSTSIDASYAVGSGATLVSVAVTDGPGQVNSTNGNAGTLHADGAALGTVMTLRFNCV